MNIKYIITNNLHNLSTVVFFDLLNDKFKLMLGSTYH